MKRKAEMGIGTLIIFIAMILVAAIAAGVLLQTASTLQNKALQTGDRSKGQVSTIISPVLLFAENGSTNNDLESFYLKAKLAPGSDPIKLDELLISFDVNNDSIDLVYGGVADTCSGTDFAVKYLIENNNMHQDGYLQRGEVVQFCFLSPRAVAEDENIAIKLIPKVGTPTYIETATPDIITSTRMIIYP